MQCLNRKSSKNGNNRRTLSEENELSVLTNIFIYIIDTPRLSKGRHMTHARFLVMLLGDAGAIWDSGYHQSDPFKDVCGVM